MVELLRVQNVSGGYSGTSILKNVSFEVHQGEMFGILGPNGSGKTTLLKMISGILPYEQGEILLSNKPLSFYSVKELAKMIAVLPQHTTQAFSYTVKETVSLGRYAYQKGWFQSWTEEDEAVVQKVMEQTGIAAFREKDIQQLSGGERQRVFLAQALAQEPTVLLLDEPTNHLDLSFQKELLDLLKKWTRERGLTVISIFHDLNLAGLYCDKLLLLNHGEVNIEHSPNEVLREDRIEEVYRTKIEKHPHPKVPAPQMALLPELLTDENNVVQINESMIDLTAGHITLQSPTPLRTMSSGVFGAGVGWYRTFINRHVDKNYNCSDHRTEMAQYLKSHGFEPSETVGMMTAVYLEDVSYRLYKEDDFSVFIMVTAGVGNAVDASRSAMHSFEMVPGTINTWVFVNGHLTEEAFIQSIMTATESKVKAMQDLEILDPVTKTVATGTSTDSILIAATQKGTELEFAGTITPLGKLIGKGVYECTKAAVQKSTKRVKR